MEKEVLFLTHPPHLGGGEGSSATLATANEAYVHGTYNEASSFHSLLTYGSSDPAAETRFPLKKPKTEPFFTFNDAVFPDAPPFNVVAEATPHSVHHQLPSLLSLAPPHNEAVIHSPSLNQRAPYKRRRGKLPKAKLSDKTRCLEKLLPCDKKMDMAAVLETSYKYIRFLQAQVAALQSMPSVTSGAEPSASSSYGTVGSYGGGDLEMLNRQQLLQVMVNSQMAQSKLSSNGCCVYAVEQLFQLNKDTERKAQYEQMMYGSSHC